MSIAQVLQQKANHQRNTENQNIIHYAQNHVNVKASLMTSMNKQTKKTKKKQY